MSTRDRATSVILLVVLVLFLAGILVPVLIGWFVVTSIAIGLGVR